MGQDGTDPEQDDSLLERASAAEICAYYDRVLHQRFRASGRVRFLPLTDHLGAGRPRSRVDGTETTVRAGRLVDATYLEGAIPATSPPPFEVADGARCIPIGDLARMDRTARDFVVIGTGKTGQDACLWLLANGVPRDRIRWVRPRDPWLLPRLSAQPGPGLEATMGFYGHTIEAAATSASVADLYTRLEAAGVLVRIDPTVTPTCYGGALISARELGLLRSIDNVVRLGHARRIGTDRIELDEGTIPTGHDTLHIHCAARGVASPAPRPVFDGDRITLQNLRFGLLPLSAAIIGFVEATRSDADEKNALCQPFRYSGGPADFMQQRLADLENAARWRGAPDLLAWMDGTRLSMSAGLSRRQDEPGLAASVARIRTHAAAAIANLQRLLADAAA